MMTFTYKDFKSAVLGQSIDFDKTYGYQCVDLIDHFLSCAHQPIIYCSQSGYAKDLWEYRKTNGILKNHTEVTLMKPGDIAVFREVPGVTPYAHIAIFDSDAGNGYGWFLGQNQGGANGAFNLCKLPYSATFDTAFRPNCFIQNTQTSAPAQTATSGILNSIPSDFVKENATFYPNTTIKIRKAPSLKGQDTGLVYKQGMSVRYDGSVRREGIVWISWISASDGKRRWMAARELNSEGVNEKPYGTIQ